MTRQFRVDSRQSVAGCRFLTNIKASRKEFFLQAAKTTGFEIKFIANAVDDFGNSIGEDFIALYIRNEPRDTGPFWKEVERLEQLKSNTNT